MLHFTSLVVLLRFFAFSFFVNTSWRVGDLGSWLAFMMDGCMDAWYGGAGAGALMIPVNRKLLIVMMWTQKYRALLCYVISSCLCLRVCYCVTILVLLSPASSLLISLIEVRLQAHHKIFLSRCLE